MYVFMTLKEIEAAGKRGARVRPVTLRDLMTGEEWEAYELIEDYED